MLEVREVNPIKEEPKSINIRNSNRLEVRKAEKLMLDNKDMTAFMCIICSAMIVYLAIDKGLFRFANKIQLVVTVLVLIAALSCLMFSITQKIVKTCHKKAKEKSLS